MFTPDQQAILEGKLDRSKVKPRKGANGRTVSYVEGWYVVDMANEVFGFGNWDAETVEMKREHEPVQIPPSEEHPKGGIVVTYSARVRVTVYSQDGSRKVVRERSGGHRGFGPTVGQAVEDCIKAAETDATKRAFVTFGNVFGLALYDKEQRNVGTPEVAGHRRHIEQGHERPMAPIDEGFEQMQAPRQTTSQRALAASSRAPPPPGANGRDKSPLPY
jgi:recombination DNA repair RAD52 pathway protein